MSDDMVEIDDATLDVIRRGIEQVGVQETGAMMRLAAYVQDAGVTDPSAGVVLLRDAGLVNVIDGAPERGDYMLRVTPKGMRVARGELSIVVGPGTIEVSEQP